MLGGAAFSFWERKAIRSRMESQPTTMVRIGDWYVNPSSGQISREGETTRLDVRTMRVLLCLAERPGQVVSIDELLDHVWPEVSVAQDSVYQAVATLRRALGDDAKIPTYVETMPRLGYRLVAAVSQLTEKSVAESDAPRSADNENVSSSATARSEVVAGTSFSRVLGWLAVAVLGIVLAAAFFFHAKSANTNRTPSTASTAQQRNSIAVLPFLDLTESMNEEPFADGITEELIDKLSKVPGLQVSPPTSSFFFKGKQIPVGEIANTLHVAYLLDGSVRKSGLTLRVAARLIRADNGYVVWSETYDRRFDDILKLQDDIASEVTKALKTSIDGSGQTR